MRTRAIAITAVAGALLLGGASAAAATGTYPAVAPTCHVAPATIVIDTPATITCVWPDRSLDGHTVVFSVSGPGVHPATLASVADALTGAARADVRTIEKVIDGDTATVTFTGPAARRFDIGISWGPDGGSQSIELGVTVTDTADGDAAADLALATTGAEASDALLWSGVGVLSAGAVALAAALLRRRRRA